MGNGYFRTSQTSTSSRQRDKRGKDSYSYQHNYVDRVRLEDTNGNLYQQQQQQHHHLQHHTHHSHHQKTTHDPRCPQLRAAGWRHTHKSISHLDLATSCHGAAGAGIDHRHRPLSNHHHHQTTHHHHQQQHQHPHQHPHAPHHHHPEAPLTPHAQPHWTQCRVGFGIGTGNGNGNASGHGQLRNARSLDYTQLEREENALDIAEFYWHFDAEAPIQQIDNYAVNDNHFEPPSTPTPIQPQPQPSSTATTITTTVATTSATSTSTTTTTSTVTTTTTTVAAAATVGATLTATYLDFGSESCSLRRSRSLAVIREETFSDLQIGSANSSRRRSQLIPRARLVNRGFFRESPRLQHKPQVDATDDAQSNTSSVTTCDSHQQQQLLKQQQQHQQQHLQQHHQRQQHHHHQQREPRDFDVYYDNLKRLDALALGLSEQLHPWHNDKSDLESLNSDYFKNSLHQNHNHNHAEQLQPSSLEFEALEQAVTLLSERPRIYQSRRQQQQQQRNHHHCLQRHIDLGAESCPEHSQSSIFPETTTSNSDDQTDSPSLSEQEYDLTHIEEIFEQERRGEAGEVKECYELISLTTTTRTRFESSEEEDEEGRMIAEQQVESVAESLLPTETETETETATSDTDGTLKRGQLDKLIAYDSVYLSSEDSSECTLIGESCESFEQRTSLVESVDCVEGESRSLLHISIEDTVYEPQPKQKKEEQETQLFTQILKIEGGGIKPRILSVVEKRKQKQEELRQQTGAGIGGSVGITASSTPELKRQATDSFVITTQQKSNLVENQYHSLPDVNIGVSLKVCESIDKELRTSYNLKRQQQRKETKRQLSSAAADQVVTRAETYDSIRRFGRAHQKARQKEHEEREREREKEAYTQEAEKETAKLEEVQKEKLKQKHESLEETLPVPIAVLTQEEQKQETDEEEEEEPLPPPPPPLTGDEEEHYLAVSISQPEQPKEAPAIEVANFSRLIEQRAQEIRQRKEQEQLREQEQQREQEQLREREQEQLWEKQLTEQTSREEKLSREKQELLALQRKEQNPRKNQQSEETQPQSFRIIVTDAQNNIIQTEAIQEKTIASTTNTNTNPTFNYNPASTAVINPPHSHSQRTLRRSCSSSSSGKPPERRVLSTGAPIYKARPIKVLSSDSFNSRSKMSRPQILHVVDSNGGNSNNGLPGTLRRRSSSRSIASTVSSGGEIATEYLQKVDAVKCYWNKLAGNEPSKTSEIENDQETNSSSRLHFKVGDKVAASNTGKTFPVSNDFSSIMPPSIEIVELGDGAQKATIVSAAQQQQANDVDDDDDDEDAAQFDHIRYKVLKSQQLIRSNILTARNKKEAQFDGLIQYLQDYSFQELLSNNNVVIVEPVRTKIERPLTVGVATPKPIKKQPAAATTSTTTKKPRQRQFGAGAAAKRHFFYQPVRVNRELYEEELPDPDTVRNVRRFFEQNVMPTPGQGILVQSQQKFGGSACQLSPKTRRARGYRYLTIDTSYGAPTATEEQPKGMELLEEHKVKHWDNASLSSGISSGDLSSPCGEYHNQQETSPMMACKGVHVLDVVRRHNSNAANAKARAKLASRRTWCVGVGGAGGSTAGDTRYRQIYEQAKLEAQEEQGMNNHQQDEDEDGDDNDAEDDYDVETDMCESYYVSNDVLAKIRECGSTVTYYGGRVLEPGLTLPGQSNHQLLNVNVDNAMTRTRSRVRQIEACNECFEHEQHQQQQHQHQQQQHQQQQQLQQLDAQQQQDSYQGIKFKLVKSNSCSSRLELAGAEEAQEGDCERESTSTATNLADSEMVRKMVHHFECNQPALADVNQNCLTINSQSHVGNLAAQEKLEKLVEKQDIEDILGATARRQVTVNNHINVMMPPEREMLANGHGEATTTTTTYHSQAMNIRLELSAGGRGSDKPNNNSKVCRNRNVDLAYTLAKPKDAKIIQNSVMPQKLPKAQNQLEEERLEMAPKHVTTCQPEVINREQIIVPIEIHPTTMPATAGTTTTTTTTTTQERRLSNASSSASTIVDHTVVRHYVANDKSIYERRKYDEIEFEEFEIYDPAKEQERERELQEQLQQKENQAQDKLNTLNRRQTNDGELYDSLDDRM